MNYCRFFIENYAPTMNYCRFLLKNAASGCSWLLSWLLLAALRAALLAAAGCSWLLSWLLLFWAPGATLKTRFREGVFEPLENGPIWGAFGYFLVHWRRPGRWGRFLGFQNNA